MGIENHLKEEEATLMMNQSSNHVPNVEELIEEHFRIEKILNVSGDNLVQLAIEKKDGSPVIIKKIKKRKLGLQMEMLQSEIIAGKILNRHGIAKLKHFFQDNNLACLIFHYTEGKDMFAHLDDRNFTPLPLNDVREILTQLVEIVKYTHKQNVAHRDIKLDNIIIDPKTLLVTLIDFGLCQLITPEKQQMMEFVGTPDYACPEILKCKSYSPFAADIWSLGIVFYCAMCGEFPFSKNERDKNCFQIQWNQTTTADDAAKDLCSKMLEKDPLKRINLRDVSNHRFFNCDVHPSG